MSPPALHSHPFQAFLIEVGGQRHFLVPGQRLTAGSSRTCDIVLEGPGVAHKHARFSSMADGRIFVKPLSDSGYRIGLRRMGRSTPVDAGEVIGIGLGLLHTSKIENNVYVHVVLGLRAARRAAHRLLAFSPWLMISMMLNALFFFLWFWLFQPRTLVPRDASLASLEIPAGEDDGSIQEVEKEAIEDVPHPDFSELPLPELDIEKPVETEPELEPLAGVGDFMRDRDAAWLEGLGPGSGHGNGGTAKPIPKDLSPGFKKTVTRFRKRGLDIAILFDSTGSMGSYLEAAKRNLSAILEELAELVPGSRIALLTYRDHESEYLTRHTRLGTKPFAARAFLGSVQAGQGGDFEEAVDEAMARALELRWRTGSYKILIIVGDAPPHEPEGTRRALKLATRFRRRRGRVHFLLVRDVSGTMQRMARIMNAGGGRVHSIDEDPRELTKDLLVLTFGERAERDLERRLASRRRKSPRRRPGSLQVSRMVQSLTKARPELGLVEAWVQ
ncbi:MAG: FHA domain-containing protein, partial [Planctomycetota bacterium]